MDIIRSRQGVGRDGGRRGEAGKVSWEKKKARALETDEGREAGAAPGQHKTGRKKEEICLGPKRKKVGPKRKKVGLAVVPIRAWK